MGHRFLGLILRIICLLLRVWLQCKLSYFATTPPSQWSQLDAGCAAMPATHPPCEVGAGEWQPGLETPATVVEAAEVDTAGTGGHQVCSLMAVPGRLKWDQLNTAERSGLLPSCTTPSSPILRRSRTRGQAGRRDGGEEVVMAAATPITRQAAKLAGRELNSRKTLFGAGRGGEMEEQGIGRAVERRSASREEARGVVREGSAAKAVVGGGELAGAGEQNSLAGVVGMSQVRKASKA